MTNHGAQNKAWLHMAESVSAHMDKYVTWTVAATTAAVGLSISAMPELLRITTTPSLLKPAILFLGVSVGAGAAAKHKFVQVGAAIEASESILRDVVDRALDPHRPITPQEETQWRYFVSPLVFPFSWLAYRNIKRNRSKHLSSEWFLLRLGSIGTRLALYHAVTAVLGFVCIGLAL